MRTRCGRAPRFVSVPPATASAVLTSLLLFVTLLGAGPTRVGAAVTQDTGMITPSPQDFVTLQYQDFLARDPDGPGLTFWSNRIEDGADPGTLIDSMVSAPEFAQTVAPMARLYQAYFLRTPDFGGLQFWSGQLRSGRSLNDVSSFFAAAPEFGQRYGTLDNTSFVNLVYQNVLGRAPDAGGLTYWLGRLDAGASRGSVMVGFSESAEYTRATFGQVRATMLYLGMLRRSPDDAGLAYWAGVIDRGIDYASVVRGFLGSPEYQARLTSVFPHRQPLTGFASATSLPRPTLALKIDAAPLARPQIGLNQADVVYEEMVEGTVTRHVALFHTKTPVAAGPIRSVRTTDFALLAPLNRPLVGASGGNQVVLAGLRASPMVDLTALVAGGYYRVADRRSPHNLLVNPAHLWGLAPPTSTAPPVLFDFRSRGEAINPNGVPAAGVDIVFGKTSVAFRWSAAGWSRTQNGTAHVDNTGRLIAPENVVVMQTDYRVSPADTESPEAITVGQGPAWMFTAGHRVDGRWSRAAAGDIIVFTDAQGSRVELTPGTTWVELAPPGTVTLR